MTLNWRTIPDHVLPFTNSNFRAVPAYSISRFFTSGTDTSSTLSASSSRMSRLPVSFTRSTSGSIDTEMSAPHRGFQQNSSSSIASLPVFARFNTFLSPVPGFSHRFLPHHLHELLNLPGGQSLFFLLSPGSLFLAFRILLLTLLP